MGQDYSFFQCINRATFDTAGLNGTYQTLNTTGFSDDIKIYKVYNASNTTIDVSYDGTQDHDVFPPGATLIVDLQADHSDGSSTGTGTLNGRKGQVVFGKGTAGVGLVYIVGYR